MKTSRILSFVLVFAIAMCSVLSFAIVSEAKSEISQNVAISFDAEVVDGYWEVDANVTADLDFFYKADRAGNSGAGVSNYQLGFSTLTTDDIYIAYHNSTVPSELSVGTLDGANGVVVNWVTATASAILYGEQPLAIVTFSTNFAEGDITEEDLLAKFNNGITNSFVQISEFNLLKGSIDKTTMATLYGVAADGASKHNDADFVLGTSLNKVDEPEEEKVVMTAAPFITDVATSEEKDGWQAGQAVALQFATADLAEFVAMNWKLTVDNVGDRFAKVDDAAFATIQATAAETVDVFASFIVNTAENTEATPITAVSAGFLKADGTVVEAE